MARSLGSPDVITVRADVSKVEDCKRFVDETINHYGRCKKLDFPNYYYYYYFNKYFTISFDNIMLKWCETVDHLVNNAGIASASKFENITNISDFTPVMVIH